MAPEVVAAQLDAVLSDFPVAAVKVGMLATPELVRTVAEKLKGLDAPLVLDPVLAAGGGFPLLEAAGIASLKEELFPLTYLLTPNAPEAARLTGLEVQTPEDLEEAARRLQAMGPRWVLAKGGHLPGEPVDVLTDGNNVYHLPGVRLAAPQSPRLRLPPGLGLRRRPGPGPVAAGSGEPGPGASRPRPSSTACPWAGAPAR